MDETIGPAYQRVADDLRSKISSGELKVGEPIPSTTKLMEEYDVSSTVVRRAVADLRAAGILVGHSGKAVYVKAKPEQVAEERVTLEELSARLNDLAERVGLLQAHLMDLYARLGQPYPHNSTKASAPRTDSANRV